MSTLFSKKAPDEVVLCTFDFTGEVPTAAVLTSPTVNTILVVRGAGATTDVTSTNVTVSGTKILALIHGGVTDNIYRLSCEVHIDDGEIRRIDKDLPVSETAALV